MASTQTRWQFSGEYFENCNCAVVCPCLISPSRPLTARPTEGYCDETFAFHINSGKYGDITLDDLNAVLIAYMPGTFAGGNWSIALYLDERADESQRQALEAIFSGSAGGPLGAITPLISSVLGVKAVPIVFKVEDKSRSVEIPDIMHLGVHSLPSMVDPQSEIWAVNFHPLAPKVALAVGSEGSTWSDYGMSWDNSGKNGHYASINWSNA